MFGVRAIDPQVLSRGVWEGSMTSWNNSFGSPGCCSAMSLPS